MDPGALETACWGGDRAKKTHQEQETTSPPLKLHRRARLLLSVRPITFSKPTAGPFLRFQPSPRPVHEVLKALPNVHCPISGGFRSFKCSCQLHTGIGNLITGSQITLILNTC